MKKIISGILGAFFAVAIMLAAHTAEASANVNWDSTSVTTEPGYCVISGYFYNNGDTGAHLRAITFAGNVDGMEIASTFEGNNLGVSYIAAGDVINWTFKIQDDYFKAYKKNPVCDFDSVVLFAEG